LAAEAVLGQAVKTGEDNKEGPLFKVVTVPQRVAKEASQTDDAHAVMVKAKNDALAKAN
jgi:hypothetical protein